MKTISITLFAALLFASCGEQTKKETTEKPEETVKKTEETATRQLRHVVLFKFKETSTADDIEQVKQAFDALPLKIPLIKGYEWGLNNSPENLNKGFTHCFFLTFHSEADRDAYLPHPEHKVFGEIAGPHIEDVLVVDYWTE